MHLDGLAVEIARLGLPVLAFAFVGRKLYRLPAGEMKSFVDVEEGLDVVIAGGNACQTARGIAKGGRVHDGGHAGSERVDIEAEGLLRLGEVFEDLEAGFFFVIGGNQKKNMAVERCGAGFLGEGNFKAQGGRLRVEWGKRNGEKKSGDLAPTKRSCGQVGPS